MNYQRKFNFFHGLMFHHFHDQKKHLESQGSITKDEFYRIIRYVGRKNILNAEEFYNKLQLKKLKKTDLCITFDDAIKSQYDIALPVLEDLNIKSFFFVYSSLFSGKPDLLELFRYFRTNAYKNVDEFYRDFFDLVNFDLKKYFMRKRIKINQIRKKFSFYSENDIKFRLVRDELLTKKEYTKFMKTLFKKKRFDISKIKKKLFFSKQNLVNIKNLGHSIGLHSHSHPTNFDKLKYKDQLLEYKRNINIIKKITDLKKEDIKYMSHPCGNYNSTTLKILKDLKIKLGFKQIMTIEKERKMKNINNSPLEIARQDHSNIMRLINI